MNSTLDGAFTKIGMGGDVSPDTLDGRRLASEFDRLAAELKISPPEDLWAATGLTHTVEMLERAAVISRGLADLPNALDAVGRLGRRGKW